MYTGVWTMSNRESKAGGVRESRQNFSTICIQTSKMVMKGDNRAVLDLVGRQELRTKSQYDDDDFLDKIAEKKQSFHHMPKKPPCTLDDIMGVTHVEEKVIDGDEDTTAQPQQARVLTAEEEKVQQRYVAIFGKREHQDQDQASVPETFPGNNAPPVHPNKSTYGELPNVAETEEEKLAKREDMERRKAYIEKYKEEETGKLKNEKSTQRRFLSIFDKAKSRE